MNLIDAETGCYIDGSHRGNIEFMLLVIEMAHDYGFELDWETFTKDAAALLDPKVMMEEDELDEVMVALDWTYDDAIEYLNWNTRPGLVWVVEDQSLFLMTEEDADASQ